MHSSTTEVKLLKKERIWLQNSQIWIARSCLGCDRHGWESLPHTSWSRGRESASEEPPTEGTQVCLCSAVLSPGLVHREVQTGWGKPLPSQLPDGAGNQAAGLEQGPQEWCKPAPSCPHSGSFRTLLLYLTVSLCPLPQEIQVYHQRSLMEKELLFFSYDVFGIPFVDPVGGARPGGCSGQMECR